MVTGQERIGPAQSLSACRDYAIHPATTDFRVVATGLPHAVFQDRFTIQTPSGMGLYNCKLKALRCN
jgi:hypothetical protein